MLGRYAASFLLNHDVGWYLYVAREMLAGQQLYASIIEVNPPLVAWLAMGPAGLSAATGLSVESVTVTAILAFVCLVVVGTAALVDRWTESRWGAPSFAALLLVAYLGLPGVDFGQREHIMLVAVTPYITVVWGRMRGRRISTAVALLVGALAAVGLALKPHFVLVWLGLEAVCLLRRPADACPGFVRAESLAVVGVGLLYVVIVTVFYRAYLELLLEARPLYAVFGARPRSELLGNAYLLAVLTAGYLAWEAEGRWGGLARLFMAAAATSLLIMVVQGKGWSYHTYPILAASLVGTTALAIGRIVGGRTREAGIDWIAGVAAAILALSLVALGGRTMQAHATENARRAELLEAREPFFAAARRGSTVLMLTDYLADGFPLVNRADLEWASPFPHLWWIKAIYSDPPAEGLLPQEPEEMGAAERRYAEALLQRAHRMRPDFILVDERPKSFFGGAAFPYLSYFSQWESFAESLEAYDRCEELAGLTVWCRRAGG